MREEAAGRLIASDSASSVPVMLTRFSERMWELKEAFAAAGTASAPSASASGIRSRVRGMGARTVPGLALFHDLDSAAP